MPRTSDKERLTKEIYVFIDDDTLIAYSTIEGCTEVGETRIVGVYELKKKLRVSTKPVAEVIPIK